jgi:hypothetical protein
MATKGHMCIRSAQVTSRIDEARVASITTRDIAMACIDVGLDTHVPSQLHTASVGMTAC